MHVVLVGINHKTAPIEIRERLHFSLEQVGEALKGLSEEKVLEGSVVLSTCNRTEIYASALEIDRGIEALVGFIEVFHGVKRDTFYPHLYRKHCEDAVWHLFRVASSLDSMVVGEYEIQGQVRNAYTFAADGGFTNNMLNKLFQTAIQAGKAIRSETGIGKGTISIASVAVDMINEMYGNDRSYSLLIIGAGKMATLTAIQLQCKKRCSVSVINRSAERAEDLAQRFDATVVPYNEMYEAIINNDFIIVSTSADGYVVEASRLYEVLTHFDDQKPRFIIDLSVPRNVDPKINEFGNITLYSIDDLQDMIARNIDKRYAEASKAEAIIAQVSSDYYEWYAKQDIMPVMKQIKDELWVIKNRVLQHHKQQLEAFDDLQTQAINEMLDEYSDKLIKVIMKNLTVVTKGKYASAIARELRSSFVIEEE